MNISIKQSLNLIILASIAGTVSAQEYVLRIEGGPNQVDLSGGSVSMTLDVIGDIFVSQGREYMTGGAFSLETFGAAEVESIVWIPADWSESNIDGGFSNSGIYGEVHFGQHYTMNDWVPRPGSAMGSRIGSFQITLAQQDAAVGDFYAELIHGSRYTLGSINALTGESYYSTPDTLTFENFSTQVTPAPSGLGLAFIVGVFGCRRNRASVRNKSVISR